MAKVAIVVGGSGGLGAGCVSALAREWPTIAIGYRSAREKAEVLAASLPAGCTGVPIECDVTQAGSVEAAVASVLDSCGAVGAAVFAAGVSIDQPYLAQIQQDQWREVLETELLGFSRLVNALLPTFREQRSGSFVAVTSMANTRWVVGDGISAVPKAAIEAYSRGIAKEEGRYGIRSNTVAPGAMNAGLGEQYIAEKFSPEFWEGFRKSIPLRAFGDASDIGEAAAFFASDRAKYLTGQTLVVDGGYTL